VIDKEFGGSEKLLKDIIPYCSDLEFVRNEFEKAIGTQDPIGYLESRVENEIGSRKSDLRILLNRLTRKGR
jgi:hypothetical protein